MQKLMNSKCEHEYRYLTIQHYRVAWELSSNSVPFNCREDRQTHTHAHTHTHTHVRAHSRINNKWCRPLHYFKNNFMHWHRPTVKVVTVEGKRNTGTPETKQLEWDLSRDMKATSKWTNEKMCIVLFGYRIYFVYV